MRRALLLCLALLSPALAVRAEWPRLPRVEGELEGKFISPALPAAPPLAWKITVRAVPGGRRLATLAADAPGVRLRAQAEFDAATGDGTWRIDAGEIDLAVCFPFVAGKLGDAFRAAEVAGKISFAGEGALQGGAPAGSGTLVLAGARLVLANQKSEFTGLAMRIAFSRLPSTEASGELTFAEARAAGIPLREGRVVFALDAAGWLRVSEVGVRGLGGALTVTPFEVEPARPKLAVTIRLAGIALEEVVAFLPNVLSDARGRADGEMAVFWSPMAGLNFGAGWMRLADGAPASVRLAPTPGLITSQLAPGNPAFGSLRRVELGQTPLNVRVLSATFQPAGDAFGRTATVRLEAEPVDSQLIAPIRMDVNVAGPLDRLIKLGLDDRMHFGGVR